MTDQHLSPVIALTAELVSYPSVAPKDEGLLAFLANRLEQSGFQTHLLPFGEGEERVMNLIAHRGEQGPHLAFAGHTDVVPPGPLDEWRSDPFQMHIDDGMIVGRGVSDMKGAIAAFVVAAERFVTQYPDVQMSLIITGDEEGAAINGTRRQVEWLREHNMIPDLCLIGEPTNPSHMGDMIKVGRRGSFNGVIHVEGTQGHVAYPHRADNPVPKLLDILHKLKNWHLDDGTEHFQPSNLEITSIDVGNAVTNIIPAQASARFNIRFNDAHDEWALEAHIRDLIHQSGCSDQVTFEWSCSGTSFVMDDTTHAHSLQDVIEAVTGRRPELSTTGGTSDGRFIKEICPVMEYGVIGATMHQIDERVMMADLETLHQVYLKFLQRFYGL